MANSLWAASGPAERAAGDRFILARLEIAQRLARHYARDREQFDDLYQEACLGLVEIARRLPAPASPEGLARAEGLAVIWMRRRVVRALARRAFPLGDPPLHALRDWLRLLAAGHRLRAALGREPTPAEVARAAGLGSRHAAALLHTEAPVLSLSALLDDRDTAHQEPPAPEPAVTTEDRLALADALARLPPLERAVLSAQFAYRAPYVTARALARQLRMSVRRVVALRRRALDLLRAELLDLPRAA